MPDSSALAVPHHGRQPGGPPPERAATACGDDAAHRENCDEALAGGPSADHCRDGLRIVLPAQAPQLTAAAARGLLNVIVKAANKASVVADDADPDLD